MIMNGVSSLHAQQASSPYPDVVLIHHNTECVMKRLGDMLLV